MILKWTKDGWALGLQKLIAVLVNVSYGSEVAEE
jgi:hypothetical protein